MQDVSWSRILVIELYYYCSVIVNKFPYGNLKYLSGDKNRRGVFMKKGKILVVSLIALLITGGLVLTGCDDYFGGYYGGGGGYYGGDDDKGGERLYSYTFHNESTFFVTVQVVGVTTFSLNGGERRTVNNVPDNTNFIITPPVGRTASWDSAGSNIYIYVF
jgi:hypothetical protein